MPIPSCNKHNKTLMKLSEYKLSGVSQYLLVTAYSLDYKPVNYLVPAKTQGWQLASFLADFETTIDIEWCTVYDVPYKTTYAHQTFYVMYLADENGLGSSFHAIPMFTDTSLRFNNAMTKRRCLKTVIAQGSQLTEDEHALLDNLDIVDDTYATLLHHVTPKRPLMRTVVTGSEFQGKKFLPYSFTMMQVVDGKTLPLAFLPIGMKNNFVSEGQREIMTDYEVHNKILRYMKFPY